MECKICKSNFHYCSSCDYDKWAYSGYCSKKCYFNSNKAKNIKKQFIKFNNSLDKKQRQLFKLLWNQGIFDDDKWLDFIEDNVNPQKEDIK